MTQPSSAQRRLNPVLTFDRRSTLQTLTDVGFRSGSININITNADVEICRASLSRIEAVQDYCPICDIAGGLEGGQLNCI